MDHCPPTNTKACISYLMEHEMLHQTPMDDDDAMKREAKSSMNEDPTMMARAIPPRSDPPSPWSNSPIRSPSPARAIPPRSDPPSPWSNSPIRSPSPSLFHTCIASLRRLDGCIHSIGLSKALVFTSSDSHRIRVWSSNECADLGCIKVKSGEIRSILCHDNMIFSAHKDCKIRMWNFSSNAHFKKVMTLPKKNTLFSFISNNNTKQSTHTDKISCMAYNHLEGLLYTGSWDKTVRVWNILDRICQDTIFAHEDKINAIVISHEGDGLSIFTCSSDGFIKIWNKGFGARFHSLIMALKFPHCSINALALSTLTIGQTGAKTSILYAGSSDGLVNFWIKEKQSAGRYNHGGFFQGHSFAVLCLTTVDKLVFSGSEDTMIRVWKREDLEREAGGCIAHTCLAVIHGHRGPVKCIAACQDSDKSRLDGFLVYTGSLDKSFKVWKVRVVVEDGGKGLCAGEDQPWRNCSVKGGDEPRKRTSMKIISESCDPVLSPAWVERKLSGSIHETIV